jgi:threonine synthase
MNENHARCTNCRQPYPEVGAPYGCPKCGGVFDLAPLAFDPAQVDPLQPGIWRYRHTFGLADDAPAISLGEGNTPLVWAEVVFGQSPSLYCVAFKCEFLNPTGSFKDRGSATLLSFLRSRGVDAAVEDSSGNAGASFAAYAARAGLEARVFVPDAASGPKRGQIAAYGAEVTRILGPRANAAAAVRRAAAQGAVYASHAYLPFNLPGYATLAYELVEQLGGAPGAVILPVGQGGLLLGLGRGFAALQSVGLIPRLPQLVGVQARACAPLWALHTYGPSGLAWVSEGNTLAEGVRIRNPVRGDAVMQAVAASGGVFLAVDEAGILPGRDALARQGFYVEPTSALVWSGLAQVAGKVPSPVVAILTGSGLKAAQ